MKPATLLGKLYLIPTTMGDCDGCFTADRKKNIDFIDYYIVENEKTARKSIKVHPEKKQSELILFVLNKRTE
jgi:16S rRNA (cytidine1402-2'-O)-methyltransferase